MSGSSQRQFVRHRGEYQLVTETDDRSDGPVAKSGRRWCVSESFGGHSKVHKERLPWLINNERGYHCMLQSKTEDELSAARAAIDKFRRWSYAEAHPNAGRPCQSEGNATAGGLTQTHVNFSAHHLTHDERLQ
jgi:hypothetical protein